MNKLLNSYNMFKTIPGSYELWSKLLLIIICKPAEFFLMALFVFSLCAQIYRKRYFLFDNGSQGRLLQ